jgi:hypothetical protein
MKIMHNSTSAQVKQVFAFADVSRSISLPVAHVRESVLDTDAFSQCCSPFARTLSHAQFLQELLFGVEFDAPTTFAPCARDC